MANSTTTLRPDGVAFNSWWTAQLNTGAGGSLNANTADNLDTSWAQANAFPGSSTNTLLQLTMGTFAFPALSQIRSVTPRSRVKYDSYLQWQWGYRCVVGGNTYDVWNYQGLGQTGAIINTTGFAATVRPGDSLAWTQADIDGISFITSVDKNLSDQVASLYEAYIDVQYNQAPVVSAITPSGVYTLGAQPSISWTYTDPESDAQERYRVKIYQGSGTIADPDNTAAFYDSGEIFSAGVHSLTQALPGSATGTVYRVYVKAADVGSNGRYSAWATTTLTIQLDVPATPVITATPDSTLARIGLTVQGADNLLTYDQASMETGILGLYVNAGCTIARSTAQFLHGVASLAMTATGTTAMSVRTGDTTSGLTVQNTGQKVVALKTYTAMASFRAATTGRTIQVAINWYNSSGSFLSTSSGATASDVTTGWTQATCTAAAPAGAAYAIIVITVSSTVAADVHYVDQIGIMPGTSTTWINGGKTDIAAVIIEKSTDGVNWTQVRGAPGVFFGPSVWNNIGDQQFSVYDYEIARNVSVQYRARVLAQLPYVSSSANGLSASVSHAATGWWLKDPLTPGLNHQIEAMPPFDFKRKKPVSVFDPLGRSVSVAVTDGVKGIEGTLNVRAQLKARYDKLEAILAGGRTLWLEDIFGRAWYVSQSADSNWSFIRAQPTSGETTALRFLHEAQIPFVQVGSPAGDVITAGTPSP